MVNFMVIHIILQRVTSYSQVMQTVSTLDFLDFQLMPLLHSHINSLVHVRY